MDVQREYAQALAGHAALVEHYSIIPVLGIFPYRYRDHLAAPAIRGTDIVATFKPAHDMSRLFVARPFVAVISVEPRRDVIVRDCFHNLLVDQREQEAGPSCGLAGLLRHFR